MAVIQIPAVIQIVTILLLAFQIIDEIFIGKSGIVGKVDVDLQKN